MSEQYRLDVEVSSDNAMRQIDNLTAKLGNLNAAGLKVDGGMNTVTKTSGVLGKAFNILDQRVTTSGEGMMRLRKSSDGLNDSLLILGKSLVSYEIAARAIGAADDYNNIQNRLKLVTHSQEELNIALKDTFAISQTTGTVWSSTVQIYQRFLDVSGDVGKSQAEIARITETVSKAVAMSGATAESANAAMVQFSQGIASGVLRGEEFNSVAEQTPALLDAIAKGMGKNRSELRAMANDGKLTTDVLLTALEKSADSTDELFDRMNLGVGATFNKLKNAMTQWIGQMNEGTGATATLTAAMNLLAQNLDGAAFLGGAAAIAYLTKTIIASVVELKAESVAKAEARAATLMQIQAIAQQTAATVASTEAKVASITAEVAEARAMLANATSAKAEAMAKSLLAARESSLAAATAASTAATTANTAATNGLATATSRLNLVRTAALGLVGGPAGLLALGIGAVAMFALLHKSTDESAEAAENHAKYLKLSNDQLERMSEIQKDNAVDTLTESLKTQNKELEIMSSRFKATVNDIVTDLARMGSSSDLDAARDVQRELLLGTIDYEEALDRLTKLPYVTADQRKQLLDASDNYTKVWSRAQDAADGLKQFGKEAKIAGSEAQNAALLNNRLNDSLDGTSEKAKKASKELLEFRKNLVNSIKENAYIERRAQTASLEQAKAEAKFYTKNGRAPNQEEQDGIKLEISLKQKVAELEDRQREAERARNKAGKDAAKERADLEKEATKEADERYKEYLKYIDDSRGDIGKLEEDFQKFVNLYDEFGNNDPQILGKVKARFEEAFAQAQIDLYNYKNQWKDYFNTQADQVNRKYEQEELLLRKSTKLEKKDRDEAHQDLMDAWKNELDQIQLNEDMKRLEAKKTFMTEKDYIEELLKLQLKQIDLDPSLTQDQKNTRSNIAGTEAQNQVNQIDQDLLNNYISTMQNAGVGVDPQSQLQQQLDEQRAIVQEAYENQLIDKDTQTKALMQLDQAYWYNTRQLWTSQWGDSLTGWADFFSQVSGQNSTAYKLIFSIQKSFAIASAALNIQKAISDGWAQGATIYEKLAAVATIVSQTGTIMSNIAQISMAGFKDGGYTGNYGINQVAGYVHGQEYVMPAEQTAKYRPQLDAMRSGSYDNSSGSSGIVINVNNQFIIGSDGVTSSGTDDMLRMSDAMRAAIVAEIIRQCGQNGVIKQILGNRV